MLNASFPCVVMTSPTARNGFFTISFEVQSLLYANRDLWSISNVRDNRITEFRVSYLYEWPSLMIDSKTASILFTSIIYTSFPLPNNHKTSLHPDTMELANIETCHILVKDDKKTRNDEIGSS